MDPKQLPQETAYQRAVPKDGTKPAWRDLAWLLPYTVRGLWELIGAAIAFRKFAASDLPRRNQAGQSLRIAKGHIDAAHIARIAYIVPRISKRLPWRSDCLIQAMAAQDWLAKSGLAGEIRIGFEKPGGPDFGAHAWLVHDGSVITGGDISGYETLFGDENGQNRR